MHVQETATMFGHVSACDCLKSCMLMNMWTHAVYLYKGVCVCVCVCVCVRARALASHVQLALFMGRIQSVPAQLYMHGQ